MATIRVLTLLALLGFIAPVALPDFSGHWRINEAASDLGGTGVGWFGNDVQIKQEEKAITFSAAAGSGPGTTGSSTYRLDGSPVTVPAGAGSREQKATWDGNRLVLTSVNTSGKIDPATNKPSRHEVRVTVQLGSDASLIVDVTQVPPSAGIFAKHSVYRKQ